jgi:type IV secretory pathway VirD2 relaxase
MGSRMNEPWYVRHPEDALIVRPGRLEQGRPPFQRTPKSPWWNTQTPRTRRFGVKTGARGSGKFLLESERHQRVETKPAVWRNRGPHAQGWYKHGAYLERDGVDGPGRGRGFNGERDDVSLSRTLRQWQQEKDPYMFRVVVSPEHGEWMDLRTFARELMAEIERDLGTKLEWAAIDHYDTAHPHLHILIRGRDEERRTLTMDFRYLYTGIWVRAREVATRTIGMRTQQEIDRSKEQEWEREQERPREPEAERERERDDGERQKRVRIIDEMERDLGWER